MSGFLSYSRLDAEAPIDGKWIDRLDAVLQRQVSAELGDRQLEIWRDRRKLLFGDRWAEEIERTLDGADLFFCVLSPGWLKSKWCRREYARWREEHPGDEAFVIRFRAVDKTASDIVEHLDLLEELRAYQHVDLENPTDMAEIEIDRKLAAMSRDLATKIKCLRASAGPLIPREADREPRSPPPPVPLNDRRRIVDGYVDMPSQDSDRVLLDIGFIGRAVTEVPGGGRVVFGARAATLTTEVTEGRITEVRPNFGRGYSPPRVAVQVQPTAGRVQRHMDIHNCDGGTLSGNPFRDRGEGGGPVELFSVENAGPTLIVSALVRLDVTGIAVQEHPPSCADRTEQEDREAKLLKLAELILKKHGSRYKLGEYRRGET